MKLDCFLRDDVDIDIRPANSRRDWMDATEERFAYRCLPLLIANAHGWVICCRGGFEAEWTGGRNQDDVRIFPLGDGPVEATGHFGYGILTFEPAAIFRTELGHNLWVTGPPNAFKDGVQPLSAVVETDWIPYSFTMNWKFTRPDHRVRFEKGEPYCFLFPVRRGAVEGFEPSLRRLSADRATEHQAEYADKLRSFLTDVKRIKAAEASDARIGNERRLKFQRWYMQGRMPDGSHGFEEHQQSLDVRPFADLRRAAPAIDMEGTDA